MVAISLYRGNLHRVPDVPRRWLMPTPKISLKDFKSLLTRRSVALSRLRSVLPDAAASNPDPDVVRDQLNEAPKAGNSSHPTIKFEAPENVDADCEAGPSGEKKDGKQSDGADSAVKSGGASDLLPALKPDLIKKESDVPDVGASSLAVNADKLDDVENPNSERCNKDEEELSDNQKRKREVEEKLQVLNQKKHNLVQVLKQILNAEEELKRRNSMQGVVVRPSVSLQVDVTNDSGSMTRQAAARLGSETNLEMEGVEGDELSNHNIQSRHMFRMNSTSPSSESPLRRPAHIQHNVVPHPSRASLGATGTSPSRFAPIGQLGHPANLPTLSVSGTNYMASSPSPATSGGTSAFRDARLPSPWN